MPKSPIGVEEGFLMFQIIPLNKDGTPIDTWLPLRVEETELASDLWEEIRKQLVNHPNSIFRAVGALDLKLLLNVWLTPASLKSIKEVTGILEALGIEPNDTNLTILTDLIKALVADVNLVPLVFDAKKAEVTMSIQGAETDLMVGDYGIRATRN